MKLELECCKVKAVKNNPETKVEFRSGQSCDQLSKITTCTPKGHDRASLVGWTVDSLNQHRNCGRYFANPQRTVTLPVTTLRYSAEILQDRSQYEVRPLKQSWHTRSCQRGCDIPVQSRKSLVLQSQARQSPRQAPHVFQEPQAGPNNFL